MTKEFEFTRKELYEIETRFDIHAGQHAHGLATILDKLKVMGNDNKLSKKIFDEAVESYDMFRTISAKANNLRKKLKD